MKRYYLVKGDKAGSAEIIEGLSKVTYNGVQLVTVGMKTRCHTCNQEGHIEASGTRTVLAPNGQPFALSGDSSVCSCASPQIFTVTRNLQTVDEPQTHIDCSYLNGAARTVRPPLSAYTRNNDVQKTGDSVNELRSFFFSPGYLSAQKQQVTVNNHPIDIYTDSTTPPPEGSVSPSLDQVISALSKLPPPNYLAINSINLDPFSPESPILGVTAVPSSPTSGPGHITLFPINSQLLASKYNGSVQGGNWSDDIVYETMLHESSHAVQHNMFLDRVNRSEVFIDPSSSLPLFQNPEQAFTNPIGSLNVLFSDYRKAIYP